MLLKYYILAFFKLWQSVELCQNLKSPFQLRKGHIQTSIKTHSYDTGNYAKVPCIFINQVFFRLKKY